MNVVYPDFKKNEPDLKENAERYFTLGWEIFPMIVYMNCGIEQTIYAGPCKEVTFDSYLFYEHAEELKKEHGFWNVIACKTGPSGITVLERDPKIKNSEVDSFLNDSMIRAGTPDGKIRYFFQQSPQLNRMDRKDLGIRVLTKDAVIYLPPSDIIGFKKRG